MQPPPSPLGIITQRIGSVRLYSGGKATLSTAYTTVIGSWAGKVAFG